ncbi:MAG TPA: transglutaminase domain-containing protein, partial [Steroidobacteraceae bacterium]|nr:transglutaminase domain-containing protein [Steroidobacteraceae bacterium]
AANSRIRVTISVPGSSPRLESFWLDVNSQVARRERVFYTIPLSWETCERNCNAQVAKPFDLMARLIVPSPFRIPRNALNGPIRYVISRADGVAPRLPVTNEQDVVADGSTAVVTICKTCGMTVPLTEAERRSYLASNSWVQSDAAAVQSFARRNSGKGTAQQVMTRLVDAVRAHMTGEVDYLGYASATQALAARSGDCTEFSVLLAAAGRARGIPTRIVVGLVYAGRFSGKKDVFSPHTWVQAWTGDRWVSYDAGLERFDASHIALAVGDGDPRRTDMNSGTGQWRIEKLGLVK